MHDFACVVRSNRKPAIIHVNTGCKANTRIKKGTSHNNALKNRAKCPFSIFASTNVVYHDGKIFGCLLYNYV